MIKHLTKDIDLSDKTVLLMGLGLNGGGLGTAKFLAPKVKKLIITDLKSKEELLPSINQLNDFTNIEYRLGEHRLEDFVNSDIIFKGAGIKLSNKYIAAAIEKNVIIDTDIGYFFEITNFPKIGITGSKGKSTTTSLVYEIISKKIKDTILGGNITINPLNSLIENKNAKLAVLELSSWQLADLAIHKKSPDVSIITTIFPDHLNYYKDMDEYYNDKKYIFKFQNKNDYTVLNIGNRYLFNTIFKNEIKSKKIGVINYDENQITEENEDNKNSILENPLLKLYYFLNTDNYFALIKFNNNIFLIKRKTNKLNLLYLKSFLCKTKINKKSNKNNISDIGINDYKFSKYKIKDKNKIKNLFIDLQNKFYLNSSNDKKSKTNMDSSNISVDISKFELYELPDIKNIKLPGEHNKTNILLSISAAFLFDIELDDIYKNVEEFSGPEFRLQIIREFNGVTFINDTTATVPDAVAASINAVKDRGRIFLIAGGVDKNLPIDKMVLAIKEHVHKLYLLEGSGSDLIEKKLIESGYNFIESGHNNLTELVNKIAKQANKNDIVLLSPGFASFNLFVNEFDRGRIFNEAVMNLK